MRRAIALAVWLAAAGCASPPVAAPSAAAPPTPGPVSPTTAIPTAAPTTAAPPPTPAASSPAAPSTVAPTVQPATAAPAATIAAQPSATPASAPPVPAPTAPPTPAPAAVVMWETDDQGRWSPRGAPPACPPQPMLVSPTALAAAVSVLYPGQYRPEYKPHGGLRFDGAPNAIEVRAPADMYLYRGSRYPIGSYPGVHDPNELQYLFDFQMPCGVLIRMDHLRKLAPRFQAIAETFPLPTVTDSRTTSVAPALVRKGELIATEIGGTGNVGYDLGIYDLRAPNAASRDSAYAARRLAEDGPRWMALAGHAVCWLRDWLPPSEAAALAALPGTAPSFKTSDYCR